MKPLFIICGVAMTIVGLNSVMILATILRNAYRYLRLRSRINSRSPLL